MALAETTLGAAVTVNDNIITVASATSISAGRVLQVDGEIMQVTKAYVAAATQVPVLRGQLGTVTAAHVTSARIVHGDATDFGASGAGLSVNYPPNGRARLVTSVTATGTLALAPAGVDHLVTLNGTSVITLTIPVPTKDKDGDRLTIVANGAAAHVPTFSSGLGLAGSSYDAVTLNGTGTLALEVIACNEAWCMPCAPAMGGTVTNIIGTIG